LEERRGGIRMEAMKKQFEYQLEEEELTHIRWFLTRVAWQFAIACLFNGHFVTSIQY
jgi:hypothetical protein